ncbi:MAG: nucleotidyltransferase family protein [Methylocystaceae bacterium]|nr:nucleotidyltransferase family protein [Methylocystaceae bacterium]
MSVKVTSGMVLAAGLGTRMRPLTLTTPKPLIKVAGRTMADHCLDRLKEAGIEDAVLNISYLGDQIKEHFSKRNDLSISFSEENEPLETGGGVVKALPLLKGDVFCVMNGDAVLVNGPHLALNQMTEQWDKEAMDVLLLLHPKDKAIGYNGAGDFYINDVGKPDFRDDRKTAPYVFTGVQLLARTAFDKKTQQKWSLREIYQDAIQQGRARALIHEGDWLHVGTPDGLQLAEDYFAKNS